MKTINVKIEITEEFILACLDYYKSIAREQGFELSDAELVKRIVFHAIALTTAEKMAVGKVISPFCLVPTPDLELRYGRELFELMVASYVNYIRKRMKRNVDQIKQAKKSDVEIH